MLDVGRLNSAEWRRSAIPLFVFVLGILLLSLGIWAEGGVTHVDEHGRSFRIPLAMLGRDSWLTPWVDGGPALRKPPLVYWLILGNYKLLGVSLWSARLWPVILASGFAACCSLIHREVSKSDGLLAGLLALASFGVAYYGRMALLDMPVAFFTTLTIWLALKWGKTGRVGWILAAGLALGLGFMTKGPIVFLTVGTTALAALVAFDKWHFVRSHWRQVLAALVVCLAMSMWWPLLMAARWPTFVATASKETIGLRSVGRFAPSSQILVGTLGLIFPWTLVLIGALVSFVVSWKRRPSWFTTDWWLVLWLVLGIIPFLFFKTYDRYLIPLLPAMCALGAGWLERAVGRAPGILTSLTLTIGSLSALPFAFLGLWFGLGVVWSIISLMLAMTLAIMAWRRVGARVVAAAVAIHLTVLIGGLYPSFGIYELPAGLRETVGQRPVAQFETKRPRLLPTRLGRPVLRVRSANIQERLFGQASEVVVFLMESKEEKFVERVLELGATYRELGHFSDFTRNTTWDDWRHAIATRSLAGVKTSFRYYLVRPNRGGLGG
ncbi:MAG: phospholipid carrier-dependent glycosyltransferase [Gemmatimonadales bacterium]|nr:phospholipid carrier-dependent glycosyltransferase [Gemmatimonadales bacterium]